MLLRFARPGTGGWDRAQSMVRNRYRKDYNANIDPHPDLYVVLSAGEELDEANLAVAGLTFAHGRTLFCENYVSDPLEDVLNALPGGTGSITRAEIVEVGPLASARAGFGRRMIEILPAICWCRGAGAIAFTVTQPVAKLIAASGVELREIGPARLVDLPKAEQESWGSYYDGAPILGAVDLARFGAELSRSMSDIPAIGRVGLTAGPILRGDDSAVA